MDRYVVYKHTVPNGKVYIGQTKKTTSDRWKNGKGYTCHKHGWFWKAIEKYGWDNIKHEILYDDLTKELADFYEQYFIEVYKSTDKQYGYNCQTGGSRNYKYSEESKKNISESLKRLYAISPPNTSSARKALLKKIGRKIVQYDLDGNKIGEYNSAYEASQKTGISNKKINYALCVSDHVRQTGGYMWRYKENAPEKLSPITIKRPCAQYDLDGNLIKVWDDVKQADEAMSASKKRTAVERCCNGTGYKTAYGFQWKFVKNEVKKIDAYNPYKRILQYDLAGNLIKIWDNSIAVKKELGWNVKHCCEGTARTSRGYQWRYENDPIPVSVIVKPHIMNKRVEQYSLSGKFIMSFETTKKASAHTGVSTSAIQSCASHRNKTAGGFIWKYADDK